jgi:dipeptidyl aminopeptidase/acylaminoacyl peptidase
MISRRQTIAGAMVSPLLFSAFGASAQPVPPTVEELLRPSVDRDVALSPDGEKIALLSVNKVGDKSIATVGLQQISNTSVKPLTIRLGEVDVQQVVWANDNRLLIWVLLEVRDGASTGSYIPNKLDEPVYMRRVLSISLDGQQQVILFDDNSLKLRQVFDLGRVVDMLPDDPDHILMQAWHSVYGVWALYKVNVNTGSSAVVEVGATGTYGWTTQKGVPLLRYDSNMRGTVLSIYTRAPGQKSWTFLRKIHRDELRRMDFEVVGGTEEPGVLLVVTQTDSDATRVLRKFDLTSLSFGEVIAARPDRDMEDAFIDRRGRYLGARFIEDRTTYSFVDPTLGGHFRGLNTFLSNATNIDLLEASDNGDRFLAKVSGPRQPGSYFLYDRKAKRFDLLGERKPWLTPDRLARVETLKVATRDGATLTAYLTVPLSAGPHPLVVLPHGGPESRDSVGFDTFAQAFAAQGWLVLQPNFRGSGGYGRAFADAGRKRWGDLMQEDVEDAVAQVIATGRTKPDQVAICGASYGGYAALMGAVRRSVLYRSAVSIAGVSDLPAIMNYEREDGLDSPSYQYWAKTIGDPVTDRAALELASPARRAKEIKAPILLLHGGMDTTVPPNQSRIMAKALRAAGCPVDPCRD